jgi:hypothetical protein
MKVFRVFGVLNIDMWHRALWHRASYQGWRRALASQGKRYALDENIEIKEYRRLENEVEDGLSGS